MHYESMKFTRYISRSITKFGLSVTQSHRKSAGLRILYEV
jgi:hypothetical protein